MDNEGKPAKIGKDGARDGRGQSEGSKASQFASGDGRSRPGRKKGSKDEKTLVMRVRDMKVPMGSGNGRRSVPLRYAMFLAQAKKAMSGDTKAAEFLAKRFERYETPVTEPDATKALLQEDAAILADAAARGMAIAAVPGNNDDSDADA